MANFIRRVIAEHVRLQHSAYPANIQDTCEEEHEDELPKTPDEHEIVDGALKRYWTWVKLSKAAARVGRGLVKNGDSASALLLQCEHWLEATDKQHRYGSNLRVYFDQWLKQQAASSLSSCGCEVVIAHEASRDDRSFFHWLDEGDGRYVDLQHLGVPRSKLDSEIVLYLSEEEIDEFRVNIDLATGLLKYTLSKDLVHTNMVAADRSSAAAGVLSPQESFQERAGLVAEHAPVTASACNSTEQTGSRVTAVDVVASSTAHERVEHKETVVHRAKSIIKAKKWIYVLDTENRLFVHPKLHGRFHHSSFVKGGAVRAAGGLEVDNGKIWKITAHSGHYRPSFDSFDRFINVLLDWGADLSGCVLQPTKDKAHEQVL